MDRGWSVRGTGFGVLNSSSVILRSWATMAMRAFSTSILGARGPWGVESDLFDGFDLGCGPAAGLGLRWVDAGDLDAERSRPARRRTSPMEDWMAGGVAAVAKFFLGRQALQQRSSPRQGRKGNLVWGMI